MLAQLTMLQVRHEKQRKLSRMHNEISHYRIEELERKLARKTSDLRTLAKRSEELASKLREVVIKIAH